MISFTPDIIPGEHSAHVTHAGHEKMKPAPRGSSGTLGVPERIDYGPAVRRPDNART